MKKNLCFFLIFLVVLINAQNVLKVVNSKDGNAMDNVWVHCEDQLLGKTNAQGILKFRNNCKKITISAENYNPETIMVEKTMSVELSLKESQLQSIEAVVISNKSDPRALAILKKLNENFEINSPKSLTSYSFQSYEKLSVDIDKDSIENYQFHLNKTLDSLKTLPKKVPSKKAEKDSMEHLGLLKLISTSQFFLWERVVSFLYSKKNGEKITILDNKISGLKNPIYEMIALRSNPHKIPEEVKKENRNLYRYYLTDSIEIEGRKSYVIKFREVHGQKKMTQKKFNGTIYIDAATFGIKKLESTSKTKGEGNHTSVWQLYQNKWFLVNKKLQLKIGETGFANENKEKNKEKQKITSPKFGNYLYLTSYYFDFKSPIEENPKEYKGYTYTVRNSDGSLLEKYRKELITPREENTYPKIDSVGNQYKLDQKINAYAAIIRGKLRYKTIDFEIGKIIKYNKYEGFRLGLGIKLNEKWNPYFSPDFYVGYGFKDHTWKFGGGFDVKTTLTKNSFFRLEYQNDVMAAGRFNETLWDFPIKLLNAGVTLNNDVFYHFQKVKISYETDVTNTLTARIFTEKQQEEAKFSYNYRDLGSEFQNFSLGISLKYTPFAKNIMTPSGKFTVESKLPQFYFNYQFASKILGGDFSFSKLDVLFTHRFDHRMGKTGIRIYGGILLGDAPIWHHFTMNGLTQDSKKINFNLTSYLGFATMEGGKYFNDKFIGMYFTHRIPWYFKSFGKNSSSFDVVYRAAIGNMKSPEYHQFDFSKMDHWYQEAGLEWNNFLSTKFNLGFFYRLGFYKSPIFRNNFAIQFKFNGLGF